MTQGLCYKPVIVENNGPQFFWIIINIKVCSPNGIKRNPNGPSAFTTDDILYGMWYNGY